MAFNSFHFLIFFTIVIVVWMALKPTWRVHWITLAGLVFYGMFGLAFLPVLLVVILINFITGIRIQASQNKFFWLLTAVATNLLILIFYKYIPFFSDAYLNVINQNSFFGTWLMPVGISFFTIQGIGYNMDVYYEIDEPEPNLWMLATYFIFFPKIAQGPVDRVRNLLPQLKQPQYFNYENAAIGFSLIAWGIFKKVVVADRLALYLNPIYNDPFSYNGITLWATATLYVFQLYCDFSGYTDIAMGLALFFGYKIMQNFNLPFAAISLADFWKRWHISFSTWLNEYLYNPLSVQLRDLKKTGIIICILITFSLSGLWHGTGWTFFIWGLLNGFVMAYEIITIKWRKKMAKKMNRNFYLFICRFLLLSFIVLSFIIGRANSIPDGIYILKKMFSNVNGELNFYLTGADMYNYIIGIIALLIVLFIEKYKGENGFRTVLKKKPAALRWSLYSLVVILVIQLGAMGDNKFIYIQF